MAVGSLTATWMPAVFCYNDLDAQESVINLFALIDNDYLALTHQSVGGG